MIKWNGRFLQGKSFQEVYDIIAKSRQEPQVELVVSRNLSTTTGPPTMPAGPTPPTPMASRRIVAQTQWRQKHPDTIPGPHHKGDYALLAPVRHPPSFVQPSPLPDLLYLVYTLSQDTSPAPSPRSFSEFLLCLSVFFGIPTPHRHRLPRSVDPSSTEIER